MPKLEELKMRIALAGDKELTIAKNIEEITALRAKWEQFRSGPNSDIEHFIHVITQDKSVVRPNIVLLQHSGIPVALAVGRIENYTLSCKFGYKSLYNAHTKALGVVYDGLLGDFSANHSKIILDSLLHTLRQDKLDLLRFSYLRVDSPMHKLVRKTPNLLERDHLSSKTLHWRMSVPENIDGFYKSRPKKHRSRIRGLRKVLENDFPGQVQFKTFVEDINLDGLIYDCEFIARKTYQKGLGVAFVSIPEMRQRLRNFADKKQLRAYILYFKNEPVAFWLGRTYGDTFYATHTGYNPDYKNYELGTILFIYMLQNLAEKTSIDYIDFGFGDAPYKTRFANECWKEETVYIFANSWRGLKLNMIRTLIGISYAGIVNILDRLGVKGKLKKSVRESLSRKLRPK